MNDKHKHAEPSAAAIGAGVTLLKGEPLRTFFPWHVLAITLAMDLVGIGIGYALGAKFGADCQCSHAPASIERLEVDRLHADPIEVRVKIEHATAPATAVPLPKTPSPDLSQREREQTAPPPAAPVPGRPRCVPTR